MVIILLDDFLDFAGHPCQAVFKGFLLWLGYREKIK